MCVTAQGGNCVAFSSDGSAASYWQNYRLFDFRNISSAHPQTLSSSQGLNQTTLGTSWTDSWSLRNYTRGASSANSIPVDFTSERVEISRYTTDHQTFEEEMLTGQSQRKAMTTHPNMPHT